ncbi:MAG: TonB-dependent receptor [Bacteroidetes bacterium]|nr:TonB-dependent receptor [Bacteroidota bacterium]
MKYLKVTLLIASLMVLQHNIISAQQAANSLTGIVTDTSGNPLIGVIVSIPDLKTGSVTDDKGQYSITSLPKGKFLVQAKMLSYSTVTKLTEISGETKFDIQLKESILERNEVIITGTSLATEERKSVTPIQSIRLKELKENAYTNVVDALTQLPGVSQLSTGPAVSKPIIRGLGYNRIITLNEGIRQEGQQWGDEHGIEIDDYNVSRIEVLKGPASLAYGSDALAGVINIVSDEPLPNGKIEGNVVANYQTNSGLAAQHADVAGNNNGFNWNVYGTSKQSHDYKNAYDGYVFNSRFNNLNYGATVGLNKKWGYSRLSFSTFSQNLGLVEGGRDSATGKFTKEVNDNGNVENEIVSDADSKSYTIAIPRQRVKHYKLVWNNNIYLNNGGRIGLILGYQQNQRKEYADALMPDDAGLSFLLQTYNYDVKYFFPVWKGWQVTSGINGMQQHNANKGTEFLIPDYNLFDAGIYTIAKKDWQKWTVSGGVRYNYRAIAGNVLYLDSADKKVNELQPGGIVQFQQFDKSYSNVVGSIGTSYSLSKRVSFKLNIATGFRSPNAAELAANGVHEGTIRYEYGNSNLKAENSLQADLGMGLNSEHIMLNAAVFYNYISNYIYLQKLLGVNGTDSIPVLHNTDGFTAFQYHQTNAGLYGGELYMDFHPHPLDWLHLENTFSYVKGIVFNGTDSTKNLPNIPPARWIIDLKVQKKTIAKQFMNCYAKVGLTTVFAQNNIFSAYGTETTSPSYYLLNAGIGFDWVNKKQQVLCSINIAAQNLTDVAYQDHLSRLRYADVNNVTGRVGVYNTGRNFSLTASVPLRLK